MNHLFILNFLTLSIAVSAFTYTNILTGTSMILKPVDDWLSGKLTGRLGWLYKIIIGCELCVSGQWALWYYLYFILFKIHGYYELEVHFWFIMQTILICKAISSVYYISYSKPVKNEHPVSLPKINTSK